MYRTDLRRWLAGLMIGVLLIQGLLTGLHALGHRHETTHTIVGDSTLASHAIEAVDPCAICVLLANAHTDGVTPSYAHPDALGAFVPPLDDIGDAGLVRGPDIRAISPRGPPLT